MLYKLRKGLVESGENMEIKKKIINDNVWQLVNESWSTSNAWGHRTHVIRNGYDYGEYKVRYINRTWEMYAFQSCMLGAVNTIYEEEEKRFIENWKYRNNVDRFKKGQKQSVIELFEQEDIAKELKILKDAIRDRDFDSLRD